MAAVAYPMVRLSQPGRRIAADFAYEQKRRSRAANRDVARSVDRTLEQEIQQEIDGAHGELAMCEIHGWPYRPGSERFHAIPDVGRCDVRSVVGPRSLIIRDDDPLTRPTYLIRLSETLGLAWCIGWLYPAEAQRPELLRNPGGKRPAWFVPPTLLRPCCLAHPGAIKE